MATGDHRQFTPVCGRSIWISWTFYTNFNVILMKHFVRSRSDPDLQTAIRLIRKSVLSQEEIDNVIDIVRRRTASNFVPSWLHIPDEYRRVVGKKAAVNHAVQVYVTQKIDSRTPLCRL